MKNTRFALALGATILSLAACAPAGSTDVNVNIDGSGAMMDDDSMMNDDDSAMMQASGSVMMDGSL